MFARRVLNNFLCACLCNFAPFFVFAWQSSFTVSDHALGGHVFERHSRSEWMSCLYTCQDKPRCISYNYHKEDGVCELNAQGLEKRCEASAARALVYAQGFVFHQLRPTKKSTSNSEKQQGFKDCTDVLKAGYNDSGVYVIDLGGLGKFDVYCDQTTDGGGWAVFQRRLDGSVHFNRKWDQYKNGFGNLTGEFWLGLEKLHQLTSFSHNTLRIELEDWEGKKSEAAYDVFVISSELDNYKLDVGSYCAGSAGDSLSYSKGSSFTTLDRDNDIKSDGNCAVKFKGGWWHKWCHHANLNGQYHSSHASKYGEGIIWSDWKGFDYSMKKSEMKMRPCI